MKIESCLSGIRLKYEMLSEQLYIRRCCSLLYIKDLGEERKYLEYLTSVEK